MDTVIAELTQGQPYRHVMGYELGRAERDAQYNTALRTGHYPLREWKWDRARAQAFLRTTFRGPSGSREPAPTAPSP